MEMNPFKPLIQFYEGIYDKKNSTKISLNKLYLKLGLSKGLI